MDQVHVILSEFSDQPFFWIYIDKAIVSLAVASPYGCAGIFIVEYFEFGNVLHFIELGI